MTQSGLLSFPARALGSFWALLQGSGFPSVPGPNLPNLDAARQTPANEPEAPPPIASEQSCENCPPCPDCQINRKPIALHGGPYFGAATQPIEFNGLGSFDPDEDDTISDYIWTFGDSSPAVEVHGGTPSHTYASAGVYTVTLRVKDLHNLLSNPATTSATVNAAPTPTPTPSASPTPSPAQANDATFVSQSVPATMTAGERYSVSVTMLNSGSTTWSAARLYRLGSQNPQDNRDWGKSRVYLRADVLPGAQAQFDFTVSAPRKDPGQAGVHFQWRMVQDGVAWFGQTHDDVVTVSTVNEIPIGQLHPDNLLAARLDSKNRTGEAGEDLVSGNFNWSQNLLSLAGRAGLNLNLPLSYNSLATWTKVAGGKNSVTFDADRGFPSVGFRLGFPSIQGPFSNNQTGKSAYLLITPAGGHSELRQVDNSSVYEAADSSYLQLLDGGNGSLLLRTTDGSQLAYRLLNGEYHCTEIKDRNGNFISIKYDPLNGSGNPGRITSIVDTLGRSINFEYDTNYRLQRITQLRSGQPHVWASFGYSDLEVQPNFTGAPKGAEEGNPFAPISIEGDESGEISVLGLPESNTVSVLTQVGGEDGSRYQFTYNSWGQVTKITHYAADSLTDDHHPLAFVSYNLPPDSSKPQTDCPRFTERQDWAENWNGNDPVRTTFDFDPEHQWGQVTAPDGTIYKEFFTADYNNWRRGLVSRTEVYDPKDTGTPAKTTFTDWTQDDTNVAYPLNPRATATTISDSDGNRRRTTIEYDTFGLASDVFEWGPADANGWNLLRRTHTDYELSPAYVSQRIIGRSKQQFLFGPEDYGQRLYSKMSYEYDTGGEFLTDQGNPVQHDANYGTTAVVRGNVTKAIRWDVNYETDITHTTAATVGYNTSGSAVFSRDALQHQTTISFTDSFSSNGTDTTTAPGLTLAYPTTVTDPDGFSATARYNYDLGIATRSEGPPPLGHQQGAIQTVEYDSAGRVKRTTNAVNGAYTRFVYPLSQTIVNKFTTINDLAHEAYTATVFDGAGRVRAAAGDFPNSTGHYSGQFTLYDIMGRAIQQTNPTEMTNQWTAAGDDSSGWVSSSQSYDWKGRPLVTTNQDGTTKEASYGGCGCAGGAIVTLTDEGTIDGGVFKRRQQKVYADALGRTVKTELLNWQGGSVYSTVTNTYNARDQVTLVRQYSGAEGSSTYQDTTMSFDGFGRLQAKHVPEQDANTATVYAYNPDDTIHSVTDARGASATYDYSTNNRHLVSGINYSAPSGITATAPVSFAYDAAGNRTSMTDGFGSKTYGYSQLSQLISETRDFGGSQSLNLSYDYNLAGELKKITDSTNMTINYGYDNAGRLNGVTGSDNLFLGISNYASNFQYRAWGGLKAVTDGSSHNSSLRYNAKLQPTHFELSGGVVSQDYDYNNDGRIRFVHNATDANFDRSYVYDHAGRMSRASTGSDARGETSGYTPYRENFGYDSWSNLTDRDSSTWNQYPLNDAATYTNNRRGGWGYDADGRNTTIGTRSYTFDADGQMTLLTGQRWLINHYVNTSQAMGYDGDGNKVREVLSSETGETTYYLRSSVLHDAIVEEVAGSGQKTVGYVYSSDGVLLARQVPAGSSSYIAWKHGTPVGTGQFDYNVGGSFGSGVQSRIELDPLGADVGLVAPDPPDLGGGEGDLGGNHTGGILDARWADFFDISGGCMIDFVPASCSLAMGIVDRNAGVLTDPYELPSSRVGKNGEIGILGWDPDTGELRYSASKPKPGKGDRPIGGTEGKAGMQNSGGTVPIKDLRSNVEALLRYRNPHQKLTCGEAIQQLLDKAAEMFPKWKGQNSKTFMEAFDRIASQGNYVAAIFPGMSWAGGTVDGDAFASLEHHGARAGTVYLHPFAYFGRLTSSINEQAQLHYAYTALHETFHLAARGGYSDTDMARVVFALTGNKGLPADGTRDQAPWSDYWDDYLQQYCRPNDWSDLK